MRAVLLSSSLKVALRAGLPVLILAGCLFALSQKVSSDVVLGLPNQLAGIAGLQWAVAGLLTLGSFWAVAQYDAVAHTALNTGIAPRDARRSGAAGIALGQTLGFGLLTGAIARWRMLPDLSFSTALSLSAFVSLTFVSAWMVITALACLILPAPAWAFWPAVMVTAAVPVVAALLFWWPHIRVFGRTLPLPNLLKVRAILGWSLLDTALAAAALFVLLPTGTLPFTAFFPLFLIALGCGLISNTPGGVGPFELVLVAALPLGDPGPVLAAILGYRLIYFALPAGLAALALLRPCQSSDRPPAPPVTCHNAPRSEVGVVLQNGGQIARSGSSELALWLTGQTLTLFGDPVAGPCDAALCHLRTAARQMGHLPMIYKCGPRLAQKARASGWRVLHMADDAMIDTASYTPSLPTRRTLRRKLRAADKAGVLVRGGAPLPLAAMTRIDTAWQRAHGPARGGSMGRFAEGYVQDQWVGCAYVAGTLIAFVTAHRSETEWCLDLMRHDQTAPDGTMHALVHAAITHAQRAGATQFCLAATPACPDPASALWRWAAQQISSRAGGPGLRQFKSSFAPQWVPRYGAARSWRALAFGLADLTRAVHNPLPLPPASSSGPHVNDENYELASKTAT
ncbi:phosphatidylglycerol lysyltransferase domain-containing protein [uncultured Tateyamaria sp.]|uniref:phosphatidylglycerol lysyltransferase domain-containing protein n=1 Tax=uncultured Tateyamaria sp. TaxID=455651 RepID=UPI0026376A89|nr:phosphatidylglycerol lysyltransferase domain-containing protein [uncultured Tateyamaria sp.]